LAQTSAAPPPKLALINLQEAIAGTIDGQNAANRLDVVFAPKQAKLEAQEKEIEILQDQLDKPGLSDQDKEKLSRQIDEKTLVLNKATQDADAELDAAQKKMLAELAPKMIACVVQYAKDHGYAMILDISESETAKMYAPNATDVTKEVIAAYEIRK
jgi:outer membrane protein